MRRNSLARKSKTGILSEEEVDELTQLNSRVNERKGSGNKLDISGDRSFEKELDIEEYHEEAQDVEKLKENYKSIS